MKMSKSIKDYKEAMDNIKISESFYKRTETLLTEIPTVEIEKRPVFSGRHISAVVMSAAACLICVIGIRLAVGNNPSDIVTETVSDIDDGEIFSEIETDADADELIDDLEEYDDEIDINEEPDNIKEPSEAHEESAAVNPEVNTKAQTAAASAAAPADAPSETATTTAPPQNDTGKNTATSAKPVVMGIDPYGFSSAAATVPNGTETDEEPSAALHNPGVSGSSGSDGGEVVDTDIMEDVEDDIEYDEAAPTAAAGNTPLFSELSLNNTTVDVTPYFDMGSIKSGEGTLKKSGTEFKPILDLISNIDSDPSVTKIKNGSFTSVFSIRIYDANIDLEFYSIYLTTNESIVITKHSPDGSQVRETYALRREYYESIRHSLFLLFGSESDYELFENLVSGK